LIDAAELMHQTGVTSAASDTLLDDGSVLTDEVEFVTDAGTIISVTN